MEALVVAAVFGTLVAGCRSTRMFMVVGITVTVACMVVAIMMAFRVDVSFALAAQGMKG